ncbi:MAG TPA: dihydroorotate dehydrogenase [Candidatus Krumholzibacteria bacterium]|nr:dihydroorotate dehydrogenase [Candidatus Krumholzibacteria bacterium]
MSEYPVQIGPARFANPYFAASGCFGYGLEYRDFIRPDELGAVVTKTVTPLPRAGNSVPRLQETPAGLLNSIGLQNVGIEAYLRDKLAPLVEAGGTPFVSIAAETMEEYARMAALLADHPSIRAVEVNLGCPNVDTGGDRDAAEARAVERITRVVKDRLPDRAVAIKLTPNVTDIVHLARGAEQGGADAVVAINTVVGMDIDIARARPTFARVRAGLSGPAIFPIALLKVWEIAGAVRIPVIAVGGIASANDVIKFFMAGATAVQLGTLLFSRPTLLAEVKAGVAEFLAARTLDHPHRLRLSRAGALEVGDPASAILG